MTARHRWPTPTTLPRVVRVIRQDTDACTLELESGAWVELNGGSNAMLSGLHSDGLAILAYLGTSERDGALYAVPEALLPDLHPYFPLTNGERATLALEGVQALHWAA